MNCSYRAAIALPGAGIFVNVEARYETSSIFYCVFTGIVTQKQILTVGFFFLSEASSRRDAERRMPGDCTACSASAPALPHGDCNPSVLHSRQPHGAMSFRLYPLPYLCLFARLQLRPPPVAPVVKLRLVHGRYPQNNISI